MAECCLCRIVFEIVDPNGLELVIEEELDVGFEPGNPVIIADIAQPYDGPYEITPKINTEQILETRDKRMTEDLTVHQITIAEVSNPYGGKTVTIGIV